MNSRPWFAFAGPLRPLRWFASAGKGLALLLMALPPQTPAADWHVTTNGTSSGPGTITSAWDLPSALINQAKVQPGDTLWIHPGAYRHPNRKPGGAGYEVRLAGTAAKPIHIRAMPGQRVTLDGGLTIQPPSTFVWIRDLEILVSENLSRSRRFEESGSSPKSYDRPWGGLTINTGAGCKFINLIIHDNAQGVSWWTGSKDSELHGCIIYDNGWEAPDRGHGHAIYTQNNEGVKTISDCLMFRGYGYTLHAYGSSRADVNNYLVTGNVCFNAGPFLIGGGKPSRQIRVRTNFLHQVTMQLGYQAPYNQDCEVVGNLIINGGLNINKFQQVVNEGNLLYGKDQPRPAGARLIVRPNHYDPQRAHLIINNWEKATRLQVHPDEFLKPGDSYRVMDPGNFFGQPVITGIYDGKGITLPMAAEFATFVLVKGD